MQKPVEKVIREVFSPPKFQLITMFVRENCFHLFFTKIDPLCVLFYISTWPGVQRHKVKLKLLRKPFQSLILLPVDLNCSSFPRGLPVYFYILLSESFIQMFK